MNGFLLTGGMRKDQEEEAIEIAIERFGGEQEMRSVIGQLFKALKTFAKWVLYLAVTILVFSSTVFGVYLDSKKKQKFARKFYCFYKYIQYFRE